MKCRHCGVEIKSTVLESLWHEVGNTEILFPQYCRNMDTLHEPEPDTDETDIWVIKTQDVPT